MAWRTVQVDNVPISIGRFLPGTPVDPARAWSDRFTAAVAQTLASLHDLGFSGWGPLRDTDERLVGISSDQTAAAVDRWYHATMWPFDGSDLRAHPLARLAPESVGAVDDRSESIRSAARGRRGVVHSDLHPQHLLVDSQGRLAGLLDFGDAFIASRAWDFALLIHYYGLATAAGVARHYGADDRLLADAQQLAVAFAVYKIAKAGGRHVDVDRLRQHLRARGTTRTGGA